jgi:hypothetical protein
MQPEISALQWEIRQTLHLMRPWTVAGRRKLRVGGDHDGAYIMVEDFENLSAAYSLGVGHSATWDEAMAGHGAIVHQYDHTVDRPPSDHAAFRFNRLAIGPQDGPGVISLASAIAANGDQGNTDMILKIDIEGAEWASLDATGVEVLAQFRQIVIEFHDLLRIADPAWREVAYRVFGRLAASHMPVHVHANNHAGYQIIENVPVPEVIELCYVRKDRGAFTVSTESFPTAIDQVNYRIKPDIILGSFSFL